MVGLAWCIEDHVFHFDFWESLRINMICGGAIGTGAATKNWIGVGAGASTCFWAAQQEVENRSQR